MLSGAHALWKEATDSRRNGSFVAVPSGSYLNRTTNRSGRRSGSTSVLSCTSSSASAFQGQKPKDAYFVKCDAETTTQTDRNLGIVNILVGFARSSRPNLW